jgi:mitogen-activated protein kinase kinase kinase
MSHQPPRLSVSNSQAGPSTPTPPSTIGRRPMGARRRVNPGLFVANPDNSDHETSPTRVSPTAGRTRPAGPYGSGSGLGSGSGSGTSGGGSGIGPSFSSLSLEEPSRSLPTIPEPHPTPASALAPPQAQAQASSSSPYSTVGPLSNHSSSSLPPIPPPQPERHTRRAYTTPPVEPHRPQDTRHASVSGAVPSPTPHRPSISPISQTSPPSSELRPLPTPTPRVSSPEDVLTPATTNSDGGRSIIMEGRGRSNSTSNHRTLLQVTTDNEQFTLVDITGMNTSDAIRERIFSRVSERYLF